MHYAIYINLKKGNIKMIQLKKLSKVKNKSFENETLTYNFVDKLTKKANKFGYAVFYKVSPNNQKIEYNLIEKTRFEGLQRLDLQ
tara:strand:+ start:279 stop:533 length:255 start_codon:yes stop_codon:yes gene_type:complete